MSKTKKILTICLIGSLLLLSLITACGKSTTSSGETTLYIGGTFSLTGAYAEDCAAILAGFQDYAKYVNDNHILAPWYKDRKIPANVKFEVKWADDKLDPNQALSIYDTFKAQGMLVERVSGSPQALALKQRLIDDKTGATSQAAGPYLLSPPGTIFANYPIYTDDSAAVAQWFLSNWKSSEKPKYAFLTADNASGQSLVTDEMKAYMAAAGFEFAGVQSVPLVPTSPPTTQLTWLKENGVDLTIGFMINPGAQPTIKEAVRLGMGANLDYKIIFSFGTPTHLQVFLPAMGGELADGVAVGGGYAPWEDTGEGVKFANDLQAKYRPNSKITHVMYMDGIVEAMTQVEAMRLALAAVPAGQALKAIDVLEKGFYQIKGLDTGGITCSPLTYGPTDIQGVTKVRVQQIQNGKIVEVGLYPIANIYKR